MEFAMKKRFLSAMALLLGAGVTWADPVITTTPARPTTLPATKPAQPAPAKATTTTTTTAAAPRPSTQGAKAPVAAPVAAPCQPQQPVAPKVDLRDCHCGPEYCYWGGAE